MEEASDKISGGVCKAIKILDGRADQWHNFKDKMEAVLATNGLLDILSGSSGGEGMSDAKKKTWEKNNMRSSNMMVPM